MSIQYWIFSFLTLLLTASIGTTTYATARLLKEWTPDQNLLLMPAENVLRLLLVLVCIGLGNLSGLTWRQLGWITYSPIHEAATGVIFGLGLAVFFYFSTRWLIRRTGDRFYSSIVIQYVVPKNMSELLLVLIALVPVVLLEELLFRSLLIGGLSPLFPPVALALLGGALFGLFHSPQGLWGMAGAGLAGVLFGFLFLREQTLTIPLVAHFVANAIQITLAMASPPSNSKFGC